MKWRCGTGWVGHWLCLEWNALWLGTIMRWKLSIIILSSSCLTLLTKFINSHYTLQNIQSTSTQVREIAQTKSGRMDKCSNGWSLFILTRKKKLIEQLGIQSLDWRQRSCVRWAKRLKHWKQDQKQKWMKPARPRQLTYKKSKIWWQQSRKVSSKCGWLLREWARSWRR